ncbi:hypothetical protein DSO57_1008621 [Entomophthora muscae]|uniref:Uncharacterized protein n=1 Tax=Entomophthora muscae TaxID=34485 RepID=A0ACC2RYC9_9FUNG|nr:hypothetical protein DSO57_1008621 [Entomophthora muscae]
MGQGTLGPFWAGVTLLYPCSSWYQGFSAASALHHLRGHQLYHPSDCYRKALFDRRPLLQLFALLGLNLSAVTLSCSLQASGEILGSNLAMRPGPAPVPAVQLLCRAGLTIAASSRAV